MLHVRTCNGTDMAYDEDHKPCPKVISHVRCPFVSRLMSLHIRVSTHSITKQEQVNSRPSCRAARRPEDEVAVLVTP